MRLLFTFILVMAIVLGGLIILFKYTDAQNDIQCKTSYGPEWSYYPHYGADCINNKGEGKFLK